MDILVKKKAAADFLVTFTDKLKLGDFQQIQKNSIVYDVGLPKDYDLRTFRTAVSTIIRFVSKKISSLAIPAKNADEARAITQLAYLALHTYSLKKKKEKITLKRIIIVSNVDEKIVARESIVAKYTCKARDIINTPPNIATPDYIVKYAKKLVSKKIIVKTKPAKSFPLLSAVGGASVNKPRMLVLEYRGGKGKPTLLVGKGVTYDTGGLGIKPGKYMRHMKIDMSGASAVIHAIAAAAKLGVKKNIIAIAPLAENSIAGNAYRNDDIIKSYKGTSVEIVHTDAEGRLILADALELAQEYKPARIIDIATLTGATLYATGPEISPIMGTDQKLVEEIKKASSIAFEEVWELPLPSFYEEVLDSHVADVKNLNESPHAGTIIGGLFLKKFTGDVPWVHIDIGVGSWKEKGDIETMPGSNAAGTKTLIHFLLN